MNEFVFAYGSSQIRAHHDASHDSKHRKLRAYVFKHKAENENYNSDEAVAFKACPRDMLFQELLYHQPKHHHH